MKKTNHTFSFPAPLRGASLLFRNTGGVTPGYFPPALRAAVIAVAAVITGTAMMPQVKAQAPARKASFDNYTVLLTRNIFDPERRAPVPNAPRQTTTYVAPTPPPKPSDYVVLTGIMITEDQTLAFFAGTQPDFNKVAPVNGDIAGAVITKITPSSIDVVRNGKVITVAVGLTVPFDDSAPALPPAATAPETPVAATTPAAPTPAVDPQAASEGVPLPGASPTSTSPPPPAGNMSDAMRRMMERRQKELQ